MTTLEKEAQKTHKQPKLLWWNQNNIQHQKKSQKTKQQFQKSKRSYIFFYSRNLYQQQNKIPNLRWNNIISITRLNISRGTSYLHCWPEAAVTPWKLATWTKQMRPISTSMLWGIRDALFTTILFFNAFHKWQIKRKTLFMIKNFEHFIHPLITKGSERAQKHASSISYKQNSSIA